MEPLNLIRKRKYKSDIYKWSIYNVVIRPDEDTDGKYLLYNTASQKLVSSSSSFQGLKEYYQDGRELSEEHRKFRDLGFLVPVNINELAHSRYGMQKLKYTKRQHLVVMPTEKCNFRCVYCYENFEKGKMSEETRKGLVKFVEQNIDQWNTLSVSWFGGEPLIAYDVVKYISQELIRICEYHNVAYTSSMTTNGYLLFLERVKELYKLGVRSYQVTVDGPEEQHNNLRKLAGGKGTYKEIMKNLESIRDSDIDVHVLIRINFTSESARGIKSHLEELKAKFGGDSRFAFKLFPVGRWGGPNDDELPICTSKQANSYIIEHIKYGIENGLYSTVKNELAINNPCYASKPNSIVIGSDGKLYKCTVAFDNPINQIGRLSPDGRLEIDYLKFSQWVSNDGASDPVCNSCNVNPICHGETCPLVRIETQERPCPPVRSDLEAYIKLLYREVMFREQRNKHANYR